MLSGRFQLDARAIDECIHAELGEHLVRRAQLCAGVNASTVASQPLAVHKVGAGEINCHPASTESVDCFDVQRVGSLIARQKRI